MIETVEPGYSPDLVEYRTGWELQERIHDEVVSGTRPETLILLEHASVFTAGSRTAQHERPHGGDIPVIDVNRGGKITWHGPGQLVGYPIVRVSRDDVVAYVRRLERMLIDLVAAYGIEGAQIDGRSGVWVARDGGWNKIAAIGVRVERSVAMHGFALNCNNALDPYGAIVPCGISDAGVTSIAHETGRDVAPRDIAADAARAFARAFEEVPA